MQTLLDFIYRYRAFFIFTILEIICFWWVFINNPYQNAAYLNSSNALIANTQKVSGNINAFFDLRKVNEDLMQQNALLQSQITQLSEARAYQAKTPLASTDDSGAMQVVTVGKPTDSIRYSLIPAKVYYNSVNRETNYLTLNVGKNQGVYAGMGVVGPSGVVGIVKASSAEFASVYSLLHTDLMVSARLKRTGDLCSVTWSGMNPLLADVEYLPRHLKVQLGDTIVTSGNDLKFFPELMIGIVDSVALSPNLAFYDIKINLASTFNRLRHVNVVKIDTPKQLDSLMEGVRNE